MIQKTKRPADAAASAGPRKVDLLARGIDPNNNPSASTSQVPPDDCGESDLTYFSRRPGVSTRTRLPFAGEFPAGVIDAGRIAFVHVVTFRHPVTNEPTTRGRGVFYADSADSGDGGHA